MSYNFIVIPKKVLGILSMFTVQFYINLIAVFYISSHCQSFLQNRAHVCNILFIV